jgi:hypothetical protein
VSILTDHVSSEFFLARADEPAALARLQSFLARRASEGARLTELVLDPPAVLAAGDLASALAATGFDVERDAASNIVTLVWTAQTLPYGPDELKRVFDTFARFVRRGSHLRLDEGGDELTLVFDGPRVRLEIDGDATEPADALRDDAARAAEDGREDDVLELCVRLTATEDASDRHLEWAWHRRLAVLRSLRRWSEFVATCVAAPPRFVSVEGWAAELEESEPEVAAELLRAAAGVERA